MITRSLVDFVFDNAETVALTGILVVLIGSVVGFVIYDRRASIRKYVEHRREVRIERGIAMGRKQREAREAYVLGLLADTITDGLEEAWFAGKITDDEKNWCYRKVGSRGVHDCIPKRTQAQVKAMIKGRRSHGTPSPAQEHPAWGQPTPTKVADNVIPAQRRFGDKALKLLKTA